VIRIVSSSHRRAFSLIEAAVVLGIVGLVVGGIWLATSSVMNNYKVTKVAGDLLATGTRIQNLMSIQNAAALGDSVNIAPTVINAKAVPQDWISGSSILFPFGGWVGIVSYGSAARFTIDLHGTINRAVCIKLVTALSGMIAKSGVPITWNNRIQVVSPSSGGTSTYFTSHPASLSAVSAACITDDNYISLGFDYTR